MATTRSVRTRHNAKPTDRAGAMNQRTRSRLAKLEYRQREQGEPDDPNRPLTLAELCGYPHGTSLSTILKLEDERMAREIAAGTYRPPEPPAPDYMPENVVDVDSELLKIDGDRDGWKQRQFFLKRDLAEMVRRDWPDIDAEPAAIPTP